MRISHSYTLLSSTRPTETRSIGFLASSVWFVGDGDIMFGGETKRGHAKF